jgi:hypothetical protein
MKRLASLVLGLLCALLIAGCANKPTFTSMPVLDVGVKLDKLYIYSFLDVRESSLGKKMLAQLESQLSEALKKERVDVRQLWYGRSKTAAEYALTEAPQFSTYGTSNSSVRVPVRETLVANRDEEAQFGAQHRLIVFPSQTRSTGTGAAYSIRWDIVDVTTGKVLWSTTSTTHNVNWASNDELPVERAKAIVEGIVVEMRRAGLFPLL